MLPAGLEYAPCEKYPRKFTTFVVIFLHEKRCKLTIFHFFSLINSKSMGSACKFTILDCNFMTYIMENFPVNLRQFLTVKI